MHSPPLSITYLKDKPPMTSITVTVNNTADDDSSDKAGADRYSYRYHHAEHQCPEPEKDGDIHYSAESSFGKECSLPGNTGIPAA
jgi:hypothetical protein